MTNSQLRCLLIVLFYILVLYSIYTVYFFIKIKYNLEKLERPDAHNKLKTNILDNINQWVVTNFYSLIFLVINYKYNAYE